MAITTRNQPNLFSAIAIGVGPVIGSGWLFASYSAAKFAGPVAIAAWIVGAVVALLIALLLAEVATMYQETGLLSRLLTITHNRDFGFSIAIANWLCVIAIIPSEALATVQYLGTAFPAIKELMFIGDGLTVYGILSVYVVLTTYGLLNYWGISLLTRANNIITVIKIFIPALIGLLFIYASFNPENFTSYKQTFAPYGFSTIFTAVVTCGIFYSYYGFSTIVMFAKELKNPQRNIPLALVGSILICMVVYLLLQISFIGAVNPAQIANDGWHSLSFTSPLADLAILLGMNWLAIVLYVDAAISPSGAGIIYTGSGARNLQSMAEDGQMPKFFSQINQKFYMPRRALLLTLVLACPAVIMFDSWQKMVVFVTVFQLLSCLAITIAFTGLRNNNPDKVRTFKLPLGKLISVATYLFISYFLVQCGLKALLVSLAVLLTFYIIYGLNYYRSNFNQLLKAFLSTWTFFAYLSIMSVFAYLNDQQRLNDPLILVIFALASLTLFKLLVKQANYNK